MLLSEEEIRKPDPVLLNFIALRVAGHREDRQATNQLQHSDKLSSGTEGWGCTEPRH